MAIESFVYPKPDNEDYFETFCLKFFRAHLKLAHLQKFARRGQAQFGIDLLSHTEGCIVGIQCKLRNTSTGLPRKEAEDAIQLAKSYPPALDQFIIATTADRNPELQSLAAAITRQHAEQGLFSVVIYGWQDIEEELKQNPDLARDIYAFPAASISIAQASVTQGPFIQASTINQITVVGTSDAEIDEAARYVNEGKPDVGLALLEKIEKIRWNLLTPRERYRVKANIGTAYLRKNDLNRAARAFLEAANQLEGNSDESLSIAAHGHLLIGNNSEAYSKAYEACQINPYNERAQVIRIQSAPKEIEYRTLQETVPDVIKQHISVSLSLYERAMNEGIPAEAEKVLRLSKDDSPVLHFSIGTAILHQIPRISELYYINRSPQEVQRLDEARHHLSAAIDSPESAVDLKAVALFNRAQTHLLLGDEASAFSDFRQAHETKPDDDDLAAAFVAQSLQKGDSGTTALAQKIFDKKPNLKARLLLAVSLFDSGTEAEKERSLDLLEEGLAELTKESPEFRLEYLRKLVYFYKVQGKLDQKMVVEISGRIPDPLESSLIRSRALIMLGAHEEARAEAINVIDLLEEGTSLVLKKELAKILDRANASPQALSIWLQISSPSTFDDNARGLLASAQKQGNDELTLDFCQKLRDNGIHASEVADLEIVLLIRYHELRTARDLIGRYIEANAGDLKLRLSMLNIAVVQDWRDIVVSNIEPCPSHRDVSTPVEGAQLVQVLRYSELVEASAHAAYELVRRFPDAPESHQALIVTVLGGPRGDLSLEAPRRVEVGSAVRFRVGKEASRWMIVEDSEGPQISRNEFSPEHPLSQALIGHSVGDSVELPSYIMQQQAVVEEIKNKILFRMHDSLEQMNQRFPDRSFFEKVEIGISEEQKTGHELDQLIELNKRLYQGPLEFERLYHQRRLPLASFAQAAGKSIPKVVEYLALHQTHAIHCVAGSQDEFEQARGLIGSSNELVLDLVTLGTIRLLGSDFDLANIPIKCVVSEGSLSVLRQLGRSAFEDDRFHGYLGFDGQRLIVQEIDPTAERERARSAVEFAEAVEATCEIVGGRPLARMELEIRSTLVRILESETAESIAIARERDVPLWTDDYVTGILLDKELSMPRVWTQAVCSWMKDAKLISQAKFDAITARLCGFNYRFTSMSAGTILSACRKSDWNLEDQPLRGVLDRLGEHERGSGLLMIVAAALPGIWREAPLHEVATRITVRLLDKLSESTAGAKVIEVLRQQLDNIFWLNVVGAQQAKTVFDAWLNTTGKRIILDV